MNFRLASTAIAALGGVIIVSAGVATPAHAQEGRPIDEIEVRGTKNTNPDVVRIASGLKVGQVFTRVVFNQARQDIRDRGLYSVVSGRTEITPENKLKVIFEVVENPVVNVVVITGNRSVKREELEPALITKPGNVLNINDLRKDVEKILSIYQDKGYFAYIVDEPRLEPTGELLIPIDEVVIEDVIVQGNTKTKSFVITREMETKPGTSLNNEKVQSDLNRLYGLGLFSSVGPARREPGSDLGKTRVIIPVQEQKTGQVGVVFGYSVRQRLTGTLQLSENNFRGRGQNVNVAWTVGGITAQNSFELGFAEPWIDKKATSLAVNLYDRVLFRFNRQLTDTVTDGQDDDPYTERRRGGAVTLSRPFGSFAAKTRGFLTLRSEAVNANNLQQNYQNLTNDDINNLRGSLIQQGNLTSLTFRTATDNRDNPLDPVMGLYLSPTVEVGTSKFNYQQPYINPLFVDATTTPNEARVLSRDFSQSGIFNKFNLDARKYISLDGPRRDNDFQQPKRVIAGRLLLGRANGNIGFAEQYFLGGVDTLRGYNDDRFWGNNLVLGTVELRYPFDKSGTLGGAVFVDVGDAWGGTDVNRGNIQNFEQHKGFQPNVGFGIGIRARTPIGPVRLDYGIGETNRIHFGIGQVF